MASFFLFFFHFLCFSAVTEEELEKPRSFSMRRVAETAILLLLFSILVPCNARFVVEKGSLSVLAPEQLQARHDSSIANFGVPDYGGTMMGFVVYPDAGSNGCQAFDKKFKAPASQPVFLLLDRGECYFALKAWNGQEAGAAAVLVTDDIDEPLITMDTPGESSDSEAYVEKIKIPSALVSRIVGENIKKALKKGQEVLLKLDWTESMPHPDERVEFELWTNSNDECGIRCDEQINFVKNFKGHAQILEKRGYTLFTPHYITWFCPEPFLDSRQCKSQCINKGRYCAPDPEQDFSEGYEGKDIVIENLRQLCVHRVANSSGRPWVWWDFVTDFHIRCSMKEKKYNKECAEEVIKLLGLPVDKVLSCMGDPEVDAENEVLKNEQTAQIGRGSRGDVTILPTLVINNVQYRGKLGRTAVLKAICAGFQESTDPSICLSQDIETNECLERNGGCWQDLKSNVSACKDTFRGRICECPLVNGVQYRGDGYKSCQAVGPSRCTINNGGCWSETRNEQTFSACSESELKGCRCPEGFRGDGYTCKDINECKEGIACQCDSCSCKNTWGGFNCKCKGDRLYIKEQDTCISRNSSRFGWLLTLAVLGSVAGIGAAGYIFYKYRLRSYMDSEIMAIMAQYMPLDNQQNEAQPLRQGSV